MTISGFDHFGQVFAQGGFATTEGEPVGVSADGGKCFVVFFDGEVVVRALPDITRFATRVTAITYADGEIQWKSKGPAKRVRRLHLRNFR